jgi:hypothetical protein
VIFDAIKRGMGGGEGLDSASAPQVSVDRVG